MQYLRIQNVGMADPAALTVLGVSTSRYASGTIGQFGSGSKFSIALLLRHGLVPEVHIGNLKMSFGTEPLSLEDGSMHHQVSVRYGGKTADGKAVSRKEKLSYTTGMGELDWTDVGMAVREFVSNALDGLTKQGLGVSDLVIDVVDNPRAKSGCTSVFIPLSPEIQKVYMDLPNRFLHFRKGIDLKNKVLPKLYPHELKTRIYKQGVLVHVSDVPSTFDYNLGDELKLDESRNASSWDVQYSCAIALKAEASRENAVSLLRDVCDGSDKDWFEKKLTADYLSCTFESESVKASRGKMWQGAIEEVFGKNAVVCSTGMHNDMIKHKGYVPVNLPNNFDRMVSSLLGVRREVDILNGLERQGRVEMPATAEMQKMTDDWWDVIVKYGMTNGRNKPPVKAFKENMEGGSQINGEYAEGVIWLRWDLDGSLHMDTVTLEELAHHCSGATDMSRDFQEWILRLTTYISRDFRKTVG